MVILGQFLRLGGGVVWGGFPAQKYVAPPSGRQHNHWSGRGQGKHFYTLPTYFWFKATSTLEDTFWAKFWIGSESWSSVFFHFPTLSIFLQSQLCLQYLSLGQLSSQCPALQTWFHISCSNVMTLLMLWIEMKMQYSLTFLMGSPRLSRFSRPCNSPCGGDHSMRGSIDGGSYFAHTFNFFHHFMYIASCEIPEICSSVPTASLFWIWPSCGQHVNGCEVWRPF